MIPGSANPLLLVGAAEATGYQINRSLRFNSSDSAYLNRTPSSAGNRKTWTWSGWVKRSELGGSGNVVFSAYSGSVNQDLYITFVNSSTSTGPTDGISLYSPSGGNNIAIASEGVLRDTSAWYHIVVACDTTQTTAANRVKIYVNGSEVAYNQTTYPTQNQELNINNTQPHAIGSRPNGLSAFFNGYLAEVYFIDGQALAASDFGEYDDNNIWQPKEYTFSTNPNNGTTWSSTTNGNFWTAISRGADKAFNGKFNGTDYAQATTGNTATVSGLGITGINKIRVNIAKNSGSDNWGTFALDSTDLTSWLQSNYPSVSNSGTWIDVTSQFTCLLTSVQFQLRQTTQARICALLQ